MKKELKPSPLPPLPLKRARENSYEKKNTNDKMARVIKGFAPEPPKQICYPKLRSSAKNY